MKKSNLPIQATNVPITYTASTTHNLVVIDANSSFLIHSYVASCVLTGRKCTWCYPIQCRQLGCIALKSSDVCA